MKIARVFPIKTNMSPIDRDTFYGSPESSVSKYTEIHISGTFTWDIERVYQLQKEWQAVCDNVKIGGPAFDDSGGNFISGKYLKQGVTISSRGCPNNCSFCFVPKREGKIRELPIVEGNIIQDNNLLACSKSHRDKVYHMLKSQHRIDFSGGLEAERITDEIVEQLRGLRIYQLWLSFDTPNANKPLKKAVGKLSKYFRRDQIRCYVLIGYKGDTIEKADGRLRYAWEIGVLPFAMLYRDEKNIAQSMEWRRFQREWTRPAIIKSKMKKD